MRPRNPKAFFSCCLLAVGLLVLLTAVPAPPQDNPNKVVRESILSNKKKVTKIANTQIALLEEGAMLFRSAAEKAETASQFKLPSKQKEYLGLIARFNLKWGEVIDAMRERAEALLSTESLEVIEVRRNEAQTRADKLHQEADELQKIIDKLLR